MNLVLLFHDVHWLVLDHCICMIAVQNIKWRAKPPFQFGNLFRMPSCTQQGSLQGVLRAIGPRCFWFHPSQDKWNGVLISKIHLILISSVLLALRKSTKAAADGNMKNNVTKCFLCPLSYDTIPPLKSKFWSDPWRTWFSRCQLFGCSSWNENASRIFRRGSKKSILHCLNY